MIYFVRHGETDFNKFSVTQGQLDTSLNKTGLEQAEKLGEKLKDYHFDVVFCSDLTRAKQTCAEIMKHHSSKVFYDKRLREISKGSLQSYKNPKKVYDKFFKNPHKFGGEDEKDVFERVSLFLQDISKYKGKDILIVSHGGIYKYINHLFSGKSIDKPLEKVDMKNCEIKTFNF